MERPDVLQLIWNEKRTKPLVDEISSNEVFLNDLVKRLCITKGQISLLLDIKNVRQRNRKLLDFLKRRSRRAVVNFCQALHSSGQDKALKLFKDGGCKILVKLVNCQ